MGRHCPEVIRNRFIREGFQKKCVKLHTWVGGWFRSGTNYTEKTKKNMPYNPF